MRLNPTVRVAALIQFLRNILANLNHVAALRAIGVSIDCEHVYCGLNSAVDFAIDHRSHTVVIVNEYGSEWDECGRPIACSQCHGQPWKCRLSVNHDGPCSPDRPPPERAA